MLRHFSKLEDIYTTVLPTQLVKHFFYAEKKKVFYQQEFEKVYLEAASRFGLKMTSDVSSGELNLCL